MNTFEDADDHKPKKSEFELTVNDVKHSTSSTLKTGNKTLALCFILIVFVTCMILFLCRFYIHPVLLWLEHLHVVPCIIVFALLFMIVSFPMMWGYILFNVAAGYLYKCFIGFLIVAVSAFFGLALAHSIMKYFLITIMLNKIHFTKEIKAIIRVVEGKHWFRVVALTRLTPLPFGVQNAIFASTSLSHNRYLLASAAGLLPTQLLNSYIGSTLRSMDDVITDNTSNTTGWAMFCLQIVATVVIISFVVRKAQKELQVAIEEEFDEGKIVEEV